MGQKHFFILSFPQNQLNLLIECRNNFFSSGSKSFPSAEVKVYKAKVLETQKTSYWAVSRPSN